MHKLQTLWTFLCCFVPGMLCVCQETCTPAEEGKPYILFCNGNLANNNMDLGYRQLTWWSTTTEGKYRFERIVTHCSTTSCDVDVSDNFSASVSRDNNSFTSTLVIHTVNYTHRNVLFSCVLNNSKETFKAMCCLMRTFVSPRPFKPPTCQVRLEWGNQINLSCQIVQTYPKNFPYIYQISNSVPWKLLQDKLKCEEKFPINKNYSHYETNCSALISVLSPSWYQFVVVISPDLADFNVPFHLRFEFTNEIEIRAEPSVRIQQLTEINRCRHSTKPSVFKCHCAWLPFPPTFRWYVDNFFVGNGEIINFNYTKPGDKRFYFYESRYIYEPKFLDSELGLKSIKRVKCEVCYFSYSKEKLLCSGNELKPVILPFGRPVFIDNRGNNLDKRYAVTHVNTTVYCAVRGDEPELYSVTIKCWDFDRQEMLLDLKAEAGAVLPLNTEDIPSDNLTSCTCTANHKASRCYKPTTTIIFLKSQTNQSSLRRSKESVHGQFSVFYYIVAAVTAGLTLAIILAAIVLAFWRRSNNVQLRNNPPAGEILIPASVTFTSE